MTKSTCPPILIDPAKNPSVHINRAGLVKQNISINTIIGEYEFILSEYHQHLAGAIKHVFEEKGFFINNYNHDLSESILIRYYYKNCGKQEKNITKDAAFNTLEQYFKENKITFIETYNTEKTRLGHLQIVRYKPLSAKHERIIKELLPRL